MAAFLALSGKPGGEYSLPHPWDDAKYTEIKHWNPPGTMAEQVSTVRRTQ